ncbi:MAG TPA: RDD family protein [Rhizobacter sp.]|nr:RDD family protein [Rhizobacter sp.]
MSLDTLYTAETPEGIALSLRPAGVAARALAYMVDLGVRFGLYLVVAMVAVAFGGMGRGLLLVSVFLLEWFYPVVFELMRGGATPGKRLFGLQVVMDSGLPVTPAASITRNLLRAADFLPLLYGFGLVAMLLRRDFKRLGDLAAGTLVVYRDTVALHGKLPDAPPLAPARALAPREQAAIVAWAGRAARLTPARLDELAQLARSVTPHQGAGDATRQLLGVAQWLVGRRGGGGTP